jgi:hypothetical protein
MAPFPRRLNELCSPASFYFIISIVSLVLIALQNLGNKKQFCLGSFSCQVPSTIMVLLGNLFYILFWTWVLNLICKDGHTSVSWLLVLLPFIFTFVAFGVIMLNKM